VATKAQRARFRHVLQQAREAANLSQRELARLVEVSHGAVSQWETGEAAPRESMAAALERVLNLEPGYLGGLLGYEPASSIDRAIPTVAEAAEADERLGPRDRRLLMALYRELVRTRDSAGQ
jgi:transcriptional regulator with XRE-family HTH domain